MKNIKMKKILLFAMAAFLLSSCSVQLTIGRKKKERYYELHPGKQLLRGNKGCNMFPKPILKGPKIKYR